MQLTISPDVEALVLKQLSTGAYANAEDVVRHALEELDAEEDTWTLAGRQALDRELKRRLEDAAAGRTKSLSPEEFRQRFDAFRQRHIANLDA